MYFIFLFTINMPMADMYILLVALVCGADLVYGGCSPVDVQIDDGKGFVIASKCQPLPPHVVEDRGVTYACYEFLMSIVPIDDLQDLDCQAGRPDKSTAASMYEKKGSDGKLCYSFCKQVKSSTAAATTTQTTTPTSTLTTTPTFTPAPDAGTTTETSTPITSVGTTHTTITAANTTEATKKNTAAPTNPETTTVYYESSKTMQRIMSTSKVAPSISQAGGMSGLGVALVAALSCVIVAASIFAMYKRKRRQAPEIQEEIHQQNLHVNQQNVHEYEIPGGTLPLNAEDYGEDVALDALYDMATTDNIMSDEYISLNGSENA